MQIKLPSISLASEQIGNQLKENPNEEDDYDKGISSPQQVLCWLLKVHADTHTQTHTHTNIFPIKLQVE